MLNIWKHVEKEQLCNSIVDGRYEIHSEKKYIMIKRLNDEMIFRVTGEPLTFIRSNGEKKICQYLDSICIPAKDERISQKTLINLKLNTNRTQIPACICWMPCVIGSIIAFLVMEVYFWINGVKIIENEKILYFLFLFLNIVVHELGHIVFCIAAGRKVKAFGIKLNYYFPVFFVDTSDICMASKKQKILTSLAGVYFNSLIGFVLIASGYITGNTIFQSLSYISFFFVISNLIPFIKLDGYYILSDILEVNRLEKTAKATFYSFILKESTENSKGKILSIYYILTIVFKVCLCVAIVVKIVSYFKVYIFLQI